MMGFGAFFWIGFAIAIGVWASNRGRHGFGWFLLACIISPLLAGIFLAVTKNKAESNQQSRGPSERTHVRCPQCAEFVLPEALKCKHCGEQLTPDPNYQQRQVQQEITSKNEDTKNLVIGICFIVGLILLAKAFS